MEAFLGRSGVLLMAFMKICPVTFSFLAWPCHKQLGQGKGMGRSLKFLLPPTLQHFQNSAPFSSQGCLSHPLCQAKRLRHSQAWDLDKPAGTRGCSNDGKGGGKPFVGWKRLESAPCAGSGTSCEDATDALTWSATPQLPWPVGWMSGGDAPPLLAI